MDRQKPISEFRGQYRDFASCMQRSTPGKVVVQADYNDEERKAYLTVFPPHYYAMENHEIMVQQVEADTVLIELRFWPTTIIGETTGAPSFHRELPLDLRRSDSRKPVPGFRPMWTIHIP